MSQWETFISLPRPSAKGCFVVESGSHKFRVARSFENHPTVLIELADAGTASIPRRLANLSYSPPTSIEISGLDGKRRQGRFAILECQTLDLEVGKYFFKVMSAILVDNYAAASEAGFETALDSLVTLFRALQHAGTRTAQGLWAELAIVLWSADARNTLSSWHSSPTALHDFVSGEACLEVKSTTKDLREHTFLLEQLTSHQDSTLVASVMLTETGAGSSVFDLVELIGPRVGEEAVARLQSIVGACLGNAWREASELRYSVEAARHSLRIYHAHDVPIVPQPIPAEIRDVRFTADLSAASSLSLTKARALKPQFSQLLPENDH